MNKKVLLLCGAILMGMFASIDGYCSTESTMSISSAGEHSTTTATASTSTGHETPSNPVPGGVSVWEWGVPDDGRRLVSHSCYDVRWTSAAGPRSKDKERLKDSTCSTSREALEMLKKILPAGYILRAARDTDEKGTNVIFGIISVSDCGPTLPAMELQTTEQLTTGARRILLQSNGLLEILSLSCLLISLRALQ